MKKLTKNLLLLAICGVFTFSACSDDEATPIDPIETGVSVSIRNTFESAYFSTYPGFEIYADESPYGDVVNSTVGSGVEFEKYLGLYTIDISNNTISYKLTDDAPEGIMFRTIEAGTYDRYYITFDEPQAFKSISVNDEFVKVSIISNTELKVEIGEGYDFNAGHAFTISLE